MFKAFFIALVLLIIPLYPKFPLVGVAGTFVAVRLEDFLLAGILSVWAISTLKSKFSETHLPVHRAILLYWFIGAIAVFSGIFLTKTAALNLGGLHLLRRIEYMALFFVAYSFLRTREQLHFIVRVILVVSLLVAGYGLGQQFLNWPVITTTNSEFSKGLALSLGPGARINSTFAGHYDLAAYSIFPLLLCLSLMSLKIDIKNKIFIGIIGGLSYWAMLLSASRVTFAAFYLTAGLLFLIIRKWTWLPLLVLAAIISIIASPQLLGRYRELLINHVRAAGSAADEEIPDALKPPLVPEDRSFNIRLQAEWPRALRAFYQNPVLGTGFSSVGLAVDNDYLRLLAETGLLGAAAFVLIILRFFKSSISYMRVPQDFREAFIVSVALGLVGLLLNALFIDVFEASKVAVISWTLLGLAEKSKSL